MTSIDELRERLSAPIIAAPMFLVSNPQLALGICGEGMVGSFPAHGTRDRAVLVQWLDEMESGIAQLQQEKGRDAVAPYAVNVVVHESNPRMAGDLDLIEQHQVPIVITSKSAPGEVVKRVHAYGGLVFSDIATRRHAQKAAEARVDGVIAVCGGAGGHTGRINPFALFNEIREVFDGPVVMAGGITSGQDVLAAQVMGADFSYIGTRFINSQESSASDGYKQMIIDSRSTDIFYTAAIDGAPANFLAPSLVRAGIDLDELSVTRPGKIVAANEGKSRWKDIWSAGHGAGVIHDTPPVAQLCQRLREQYRQARKETLVRLT